MIADTDLALLIDLGEKQHLVSVQSGKRFQSHHGFLMFDALIGKPWGSIVHSSLGHPYLVLQPGTHDLIRHIKRSSQVIFPKDSAYILMKLNLKPGMRVLESGCGSGGLTLAMASIVMPTGRVISQELREDFIALTQRNMQRVGLADYVTFIQGDGSEGFKVDAPVDAVFLDMPRPELCIAHARTALKDGGFFGSLVPTTNQVQAIIAELEKNAFGMIEIEEVILRGYKAVADRFRPKDRMIAHTGYLIFARATTAPVPSQARNKRKRSVTREEIAREDVENDASTDDDLSDEME